MHLSPLSLGHRSATSIRPIVSLVPLVVAALAMGAGCSSGGGTGGLSGYGGVAGGDGQGGGSGGGSGAGSGGTAGSSGGPSSGGSSGSSGGGASSSGSGGGTGSGSSSGGTTGGGSGTSSGAGSSSGGMTLGTSTWADGQTLAASVTISAGATVTIAPGASITVSPGVTITIDGTLTASSAPTHAKITGASWTGIVVASGGALSLDGVDLVNAGTAIEVAGGAKSAEYDDGTIQAATTPFQIDKGGAFGTKHATVAATAGSSSISGSFTASYLDYDSNGHAGITTLDPTAQLSIEDSKLHGSGPVADFLVSSAGAAKFHVAYTDISNVHCGFHFDTVTEFDVSYSNIDSNAFGFMLYGSGGAGPLSVTYTNLYSNSAYDYDTEGSNGPISFDHCYTADTTNPGTAVTTTNPQSAMIAGTGPR
jgi:hypothetical protein